MTLLDGMSSFSDVMKVKNEKRNIPDLRNTYKNDFLCNAEGQTVKVTGIQINSSS